MRRSDREITDFSEIIRVMEQCDVCRLAMHDEYPYILPLNFGMEVEGRQITLYFHSAKAGKKFELLVRDDRVSFEMDRGHQLALDESNGNCTMGYESVMGRGRLEIVEGEEKQKGLELLMAHYRQKDFPYNKAVVPQTAVLRLTVEEITGKARRVSK